LGVSQRATATNILAVSQAPNSSNNYIPGYTLALQTDNQEEEDLATDSFQKNASVSDVWQVNLL
jgi:hypothetical protein